MTTHSTTGATAGRGPRLQVRQPKSTALRAVRHLRPYLTQTLFIGLCLIAVAALGALPPLLIRGILDTALPQKDLGLLNLLVAGMIGVPLASGLIGVLQNYLNSLVSQRIMFDIRNELYTHLQGLSLNFYTQRRTGDIMSRITEDVDGVQNTVTGSLISIASNFFTVAITLAVIFTLNWRMAILGVALLPLFIVPARVVGRLRRSLRRQTHQAMAELNSHTQQTLNISGFLLMKVFSRERDEAERFKEKAHGVMDLEIRQHLVGRWFFMFLGLFSIVGPALVYLWGGHLAIRGEMTIGTIVAFVAYLTRLYGPASAMATVYVDIQAALALFERIFEYLDTKSEIQEAPIPITLDPVQGRIRFEDVSFEYVRGRSALRRLSFTVQPGQLVALVGPSGAGKTTITYLIPRLYDPTSGAIYLDGHDLRTLSLSSLRSAMGIVTQETYLFNATIRENLLYGRPGASEEELTRACKAAQLYDLIASLPEGYEALVGERGYRLSGGEKQRLAIARLILKDPRILIMDEATSHLDSLSETLIRVALEPLLKERTSIVVAHRLSTVLRADVILVLEAGHLVEQGTHPELIAAGGLYTRIYEEQFQPQAEQVGAR
ncbi:MAG: ABC transporter ATP-binding protein [Chloroflexi bacterium]|nr:ABC transporter ATP-binding protein [Chloroflexota bacterium]